MLPLATDLRKLLENKIPLVRTIAETAAGAALSALAVNKPEPYSTFSVEQRRLRNALRARARQLGNGNQSDGLQPLIEEIAYEQWHRMVFARFLAENNLLMHSSGVPVTLADCAELAAEEGEPDAWSVASRYASAMLPGIFRNDDPSAQVRFAPEGRIQLESILSDLPVSVFHADDALGWMYQFWQKNKKDEVNASERKIGGADLSPVTQLFTEDYMVRFLLENSLGAWWAARHPESPLIKRWQYLRFAEDGKPAAGGFPGWPDHVAKVTLMDPCCGSGHILVAGFEMLTLMRMEEENLGEAEAGDAVLRDNLFGLELDLRCTQIAAFGLALSAWKIGGYRELPLLNIACSGIPVQGQLDAWLKLTGDDPRLQAALERLYNLFRDSSDLGSLINPSSLPERDRMFIANYEEVAPILEKALKKEHFIDDPAAEIFGAAAEGVAKAVRFLARQYTLVTTNVPYLGKGKQDLLLQDYCALNYPSSTTDLAAAFIERCLEFTKRDGSCSLVTPQNWLSQTTYKNLRTKLLKEKEWNFLTWLGPRAFETITGEVVKPILLVLTNSVSKKSHEIITLDVSDLKTAQNKARGLLTQQSLSITQSVQIHNPDSKVLATKVDASESTGWLSSYAVSLQGLKTGDDPRYRRYFYELINLEKTKWVLYQGTTDKTIPYGGREFILDWAENGRNLARNQGKSAWNKLGIAVTLMGKIRVTLYTGEIFDSNVSVISPYKNEYIKAIWAFCNSAEFVNAIQKAERSIKANTGSIVKIPFNLEYWQKVAEQAAPLPEPHSDNPTQWLFKGHPKDSTEPLQVTVSRLLGYRWPQQEHDALDSLADADGIVCLPSVYGEAPAAERLRQLFVVAYGKEWTPGLQDRLLSAVGYGGKDLSEWLRDGFFSQHARLFHNRPFIWHIWDGRKDGFSALVNYHKLDFALLDKLIYTYLGSWISDLRKKRDDGEAGAEGRLVAALELQKKLEAVRTGEPPYDIYVRWKPMSEQPIGWNSDLNDGVRLNIRPFVTAGVLRSRFTINWNKDRGKNPDGSDRLNDLHFTNAEKRSARGK
jgi:hypothetical protein